MNNNKSFILKVKASNGYYNTLYPETIKQQVADWDLGEVIGPFNITLRANQWFNNKQRVVQNNVLPSDRPICTKILSGTKQNMIAQDEAFSLLKTNNGIQTDFNAIIFTCDKTPTVDFQVQVWWCR